MESKKGVFIDNDLINRIHNRMWKWREERSRYRKKSRQIKGRGKSREIITRKELEIDRLLMPIFSILGHISLFFNPTANRRSI